MSMWDILKVLTDNSVAVAIGLIVGAVIGGFLAGSFIKIRLSSSREITFIGAVVGGIIGVIIAVIVS